MHLVDGFRQCFHYFCSILLFFLTQSVLKGNFSIFLKVMQLFKHRKILKFTTYVWSFINNSKIEKFYKSKVIFIWIIIDVHAVRFNGVHGRIVNEGMFYSYLIYYVFSNFRFWKEVVERKVKWYKMNLFSQKQSCSNKSSFKSIFQSDFEYDFVYIVY